ncbi:MAG: hypothetical protein IJH64_06680, partial [Oscillospiraceae bacterium]|nr:hypothetical protein [Oscillospiraceae bacterium]
MKAKELIIMKRSITIALALALALGTAAIAEVADTTEDVEITAPVEQTETAEEAASTEEAETPAEAAPSDDAAALNDAIKAFHEARQAAHTDELKAELDEYVAAGKLTQGQADLILKYVQDRQASKQNDQRGCKGQFGGKQRGQMPGNGPQIPGNG